MSREEAARPAFLALWDLSSVYVELTKPRLTLTALLTTLLGFFLGSSGALDYGLLMNTLGASFLVGGGANALNQLLEKDIDAKMKRTEGRPLPSGRLSDKNALVFGLVVSTLGILWLFILVNVLAGLFGLTILLGYVLVYTPLKQKTWLNTFVGAVAGALPILMGWAASGAKFGLAAGVLFLILFLWQLPHFLAIAWVYREDYLRSGLQMLPVFDDREGKQTRWQIVFYTSLLLLASLAPAFLGMTGRLYLAASALAGILFLSFAVVMAMQGLARAKKFVSASIAYLLALIVFMIADKL